MQHDPFDLSSQDAQQADAKQQRQLASQSEADDMKWLMSSKRGRRINRRLLDRAGVFQLSFNSNALTMTFNEWLLNVVLALLANITELCPTRYAEMLE